MRQFSRRNHLQQLSAVLGSAALSGWPGSAQASEADIPPEGIGKGIRHISYSDQGGRPDGVQVMLNRRTSMSATCSATASRCWMRPIRAR